MTRPIHRVGLVVAGLFGASASPLACRCTSSEATSGGPDFEHVVELCRARMKWPRRLHTECTECTSLAPAPPGCRETEREFSARCASAQRAKLDAKSCEPVFTCTHKCKLTDCECIGRCYEGQEACDRTAAAVDSCVARICEPYCR